MDLKNMIIAEAIREFMMEQLRLEYPYLLASRSFESMVDEVLKETAYWPRYLDELRIAFSPDIEYPPEREIDLTKPSIIYRIYHPTGKRSGKNQYWEYELKEVREVL